MVTEWISSKDMVKLYEFSSTLHVVLQEWLGDEIMHPLGDQTWIDMSEEWAEFMFGEGNNQALCDGCHFAAAESPLRSVIPPVPTFMLRVIPFAEIFVVQDGGPLRVWHFR